MMKKSGKDKQTMSGKHSVYMIRNYINEIISQSGLRRQSARLALVEIGETAVGILALLMMHPQWKVRWEAVKALSQMKNAITAPLLINALEDEYESIRWIAAEGLINLGKEGLMALLEALISYKLSVMLRQGAHHVIKEFSKRYTLSGIDELMASLEGTNNYFELPVNAKNVLNSILNDNKK